MSRAVLLDSAPARGDDDEGSVITLSARAEYGCRLGGVPHLDLAAVASEADLAALQDEYWWSQVEWLGLFEDRLVDASPSLRAGGWRPVAASGYLLKLLFDNIFVRAFQSAALTRGDWSELVHRARPDGPPLLGEVLPLFCNSRGIGYSTHTVPRAASSPRPTTLGRMRRHAGPIAQAAIQSVHGRRRFGTSREDALNLLLLCGQHDSGDLLRSNAQAGGRSSLVVQNRLLKLGGCAPRLTGRIPSGTEADKREWREVVAVLADDRELMAWPKSWFEGQVGSFVADRLMAWVASTMPDVVASARWFTQFYASERVDAVVTPFFTNSVEIGAIAAAGSSGGPTTVLIEHGDIAHAAPSWDLNLVAADVVFVPTKELAEYLR